MVKRKPILEIRQKDLFEKNRRNAIYPKEEKKKYSIYFENKKAKNGKNK